MSDSNMVLLEEKIEPKDPRREDDLALMISEAASNHLRYVAARRKWFHWDDKQWVEDKILFVYDYIRTQVRAHLEKDPGSKKTLLKAPVISSIERLVRSDRRQAATTEQWDFDRWVMNTAGGLIYLREGKLGPHDSKKYCTKMAGATPRGECPLWMNFLDRVTSGNRDLIGFLQRTSGYALTGSIDEHAIFFFYGGGRNGKSTYLNTVLAAMGDYGKVAAMGMFTAGGHAGHPTEVARLDGARVVVCEESQEGDRWDEGKIKYLTGGSRITARYMHQDFFEYDPQFKLFFASNHKPSLRNVDIAIRARVHLIPFMETIPKAEIDPELGDKLNTELDGILRCVSRQLLWPV